MEKIEISMEDYNNLETQIDRINEQQLVKSHTALINKTCKNDYWEIKDCGVEFIKKFLTRDWGRSIVYEYTTGAIKFIYSKYLSDYFKNSIKELLKNDEITDIVANALNSDKNINDMSEEEIKQIHLSIKEHYSNTEEINSSIAPYFLTYLFKLDGEGVTSYIKNNIAKEFFASHILSTSGLCDRASFYSGRGVNYGDLNERNLAEIFKKLIKYDTNYGVSFVNMVMNMKTLGATEFINSFYGLANNNFEYKKQNINESNISLDGLEGESRDVVALMSILSSMHNRNNGYQVMASENMKTLFIATINPVLQEINPDVCKQNNTYYWAGYTKRKR